MNLAKLFEMQKKLDEHIIEKKGLQGRDLLPNTILALQVELGELANEWKGFKHWSDNNQPRYERMCHACKGKGGFIISDDPREDEPCLYCEGTGIEARPLLEEYVDCLHFILSIGLQIGYYPPSLRLTFPTTGGRNNDFIVERFNDCFKFSSLLPEDDYYETLFQYFIDLGYLLGFTWSEIEQAYYNKNKVNHERQNNGY